MAGTAIIALGGNALTREDERGTIDEQYRNALSMAKSIRSLLRKKWRVVVVHGNGPQVGNLAIQNAGSASVVPSMPLWVLGAMTQGELGSLICLALHEVCGAEIAGAVSVITHVEVDGADRAFQNPSKPIGPFYSSEEAEGVANEMGWTMIEDSGRGYRRVVASPSPKAPLELGAIRDLISTGYVVVAAGGGGIPVVRTQDGYEGIDAVIDKDFAAERLANELNADALVMVTGVTNVKLNFGSPDEEIVYNLTTDEARKHLDEGQFPPGSMGPKISAAISFVEAGSGGSPRMAAITTPELVYATLDNKHGAIQGHRGTKIKPVRDRLANAAAGNTAIGKAAVGKAAVGKAVPANGGVEAQ